MNLVITKEDILRFKGNEEKIINKKYFGPKLIYRNNYYGNRLIIAASVITDEDHNIIKINYE